MKYRWLLLATAVAGLTLAPLPSAALACPFCSAMSETLSEQIANMDAAVVAQLSEAPPPSPEQRRPARCRALQVPGGRGAERETAVGRCLGHRDGLFWRRAEKRGAEVSAAGRQLTETDVVFPHAFTAARAGLRSQAAVVACRGHPRLAFFEEYLEDPEEVLARDAYEEFARASYDVVKSIKDQMDHPQLVGWIQDNNVPVSRRRLYLTMLGVCGTKADLPWLEKLLRSEDRSVRSGLDALIACYLTLAGPEGMPLVEELFLKDTDAEYADTYAAIMALRFHGSEGERVPRERLVAALRIVLERPQLADLVIPDLARWEDWSVMPRLVQLFKDADESTSWVRVPVVNYLRACPQPEAKQYLVELEKIDPEAVKRATSFFPFGGGGPAARPQKN